MSATLLAERCSREQIDRARRAGFERHGAEGDINAKAIGRPQQEDAIPKGTLRGIPDATLELGEQRRRISRFGAEPCQQRQVEIIGESGPFPTGSLRPYR